MVEDNCVWCTGVVDPGLPVRLCIWIQGLCLATGSLHGVLKLVEYLVAEATKLPFTAAIAEQVEYFKSLCTKKNRLPNLCANA